LFFSQTSSYTTLIVFHNATKKKSFPKAIYCQRTADLYISPTCHVT